VISHKMWAIRMGGISVYGEPIWAEEHFAVIDSGSSHLFLKPSEIERIIVQMKKKGITCKFRESGYDHRRKLGVLCYGLPFTHHQLRKHPAKLLQENFPKIAFKLGGKDFPVEPVDYIYGCGSLRRIDHTLNYGCLLNIGHISRFPAALLGAPFIKSWYTLFSIEQRKIFFAKKKR